MHRRHGIILLSPANLKVGDAGDLTKLGQLDSSRLETLMRRAFPIMQPESDWWQKNAPSGSSDGPTLWYRFEAQYPDGSKEFGTLHNDGTAQINGRWFYFSPSPDKTAGQGFSSNTDQVPDASRITPMPVRPGQRAGHDISVHVTLDTGGPGIRDLKSLQHETVQTQRPKTTKVNRNEFRSNS